MSIARNDRIFVVAFLLTLSVCFAEASPPNMSPLDARVTLKMTGVPLWKLLETISTRTKASFILAENIDENEPVSADAKDMKAEVLLTAVLEGRGLIAHQVAKTGTYIVLSKAQEARALAQYALLQSVRRWTYTLESG